MDHISVVIVNYNTDSDTTECLESLQHLKTKNFKYTVIVVDNGSKDPYQLPSHLSSSPIEVLRSESNLGFTGGNNLGIRYAIENYNSEYVFLLNSDTLVDPDCLLHLHREIQERPKMGMMNPKIYFASGYEFFSEYSKKQQGRVLWFAGGTVDWSNLTAFHRGVDEVDRGHFDTQHQSDFMTGCAVLITREVLEAVGTLDDSYFLYYEDVDWSIKTVQHGYHLGFCSQAVVWHKNAGSTGGAGSVLHQYYQTRNRVLLAWRYAPWRIKLTALRFAWQMLTTGNPPQQQAMIDLVLGRLGKQPVL